MAVWRHRVARGPNGKLRFVYVRYRPEDMRQRCGLIPEIFNEGDDAEDMRHLAEELLRACDEPIISTAEYEYEPGDDDDDDDE